ncbi:MAG: hypothetical protein A2Z02_02705 [Chloroflexi bacterium RBG_16_48_7]|nr:MAG: hypothetical protein A2Z02_02705 [Chloroflexi bacterium RBG_16_48_7]
MPGSFFAQKINELTKYWVKFPMGIGVNLFIMNKDKWNSLPDDVKIIWEQINNETRYVYLDEMDRLYPNLDERFAKNGVTTYSLSDAEYAKWMQLMQPLQAKYVADWEAQGFPMKAADAKVRQVLARFK